MNKINNINKRKVSNKAKIVKRNRFLLAIGLTFALTNLINKANTSNNEKVMPTGYMEIYTIETVDNGEQLEDIAEQYYIDELYSSYYHSIDNYIDKISEINGSINKNNLTPYQDLIIPTLVEQNNIYIHQINVLKNQITELEKWVPHTIEYGDTILSLAFQGAGDTNEAYSIQYDILEKNKLNSADIYVDNTIYIVNPQIGELKKEISYLEKQLNASLKHAPENKISKSI